VVETACRANRLDNSVVHPLFGAAETSAVRALAPTHTVSRDSEKGRREAVRPCVFPTCRRSFLVDSSARALERCHGPVALRGDVKGKRLLVNGACGSSGCLIGQGVAFYLTLAHAVWGHWGQRVNTHVESMGRAVSDRNTDSIQ